jgi:hypothetical protein
MDTRYKLKEVGRFIKALSNDYKNTVDTDIKAKKKKAIWKTVCLTFDQIWSGISALFVYPIWYAFRKQITNTLYEGTTWEAVHQLVVDNKIDEVKYIVKRKGALLYWLWTFGDLRDPLGRGELPEDGYKGRYKNNFVGRYYENALRNPRFTINYMNYRTGTIVESHTVIDTRDYNISYSSEGIGKNPAGVLFKWVVDDKNKWYYVYDDNNKENLFYFGYSGLGKTDIGKNGRFEISYRKN